MSIPSSVTGVLAKLPEEAQIQFRRDYEERSKSLFTAYLLWFLFGWHYLYLKRVGMQFAFWFTFGFLLIGWAIDFVRLPRLVRQFNDDLAIERIGQYRALHNG